ncbi:MAG: hypothetical protein Q8T09_20600 [Candidatus Melainabacteria bacterium]|nr:hypothetical protein [Candidatus Melainabacteria bacterium]
MRLLTVVCSLALALSSLFSMFLPLEAKEWSIDDRQQALMQQINEGQKAKELTVKEAKSLRKDLANLAKKKAKMKAKPDANNSLSKENQTELEGDLNKISVDIQKLKLEKRVQK